MNENLIRWSKDDKQNLRRAVNNFNSKIRRLEKLGRENLPEKVSYKELVGIGKLQEGEVSNEIYSRKELNNTLRSLQRFTRRGAENEVTLKGGEKVTAWEKRELTIQKQRATRSINKRISEIDTTFGMGNKEIQALKGTLNSLKNIENKKGSEYKRALQTLKNNARSDRELRKAEIWKNNFLNNLDMLSSYENFDLLKNAIDKIKNPIKLYEFLSKSDILSDFFLWYKDKATSNTIAGFSDNQEAFDNALEVLGIL